MFNVTSTQLGNTMMSIPVGAGLAGVCAQSGVDSSVADAYQSDLFSKDFDLATGFRTKQVCCIALFKPGEPKPLAVVQLINKKEGAGDLFTDEDIAAVRRDAANTLHLSFVLPWRARRVWAENGGRFAQVKADVPRILPLLSTFENSRASQWGSIQ
jgi:hypothetical protein